MAGENMTLTWGKNAWRVKCTRILYGPNIVASQDSGQGGTNYGGFAAKAIYVRQYFMSTVGITIIQSTWEDREAFSNWCIAYGKYISSRNGAPVPMRIQGPRGFDFYGVLTEGFGKTNAVTDLAYEMNLTFRGSQPTTKGMTFGDPGTKANLPTSIGGANSKFYPFEAQPSGPAVSVQTKLYDTPLNDTGGFPITLPPSVSVPTQPAGYDPAGYHPSQQRLNQYG